MARSDDLHGFNLVEDNGDPWITAGAARIAPVSLAPKARNGMGVAGVNWNVKIMPLRFMDGDGTGTTKDAIEAINYCHRSKRAGVNVRIISASWGSTARSCALEDVIRKALRQGNSVHSRGLSNANSDNDRSFAITPRASTSAM